MRKIIHDISTRPTRIKVDEFLNSCTSVSALLNASRFSWLPPLIPSHSSARSGSLCAVCFGGIELVQNMRRLKIIISLLRNFNSRIPSLDRCRSVPLSLCTQVRLVSRSFSFSLSLFAVHSFSIGYGFNKLCNFFCLLTRKIAL